MTAVDFRDLGPAARFARSTVYRLRNAGPTLRLWLALTVLAGIAIAIDTSRVCVVLRDAAQIERDRDALGQRVAQESKAAASVMAERKELLNMLTARRDAAAEAAEIVRIGNAISHGVALTALRRLPDGFAIEGKSLNIADISTTLRRLATPGPWNVAFELRREGASDGAVSFELVFRATARKSPR